MSETIFVLTVMYLHSTESEQFHAARRHRTWGWFPSLAQAELTVMSNDADIYEDGYYNIVVVEEMSWGSMAMAVAEHWYAAKPVVVDHQIQKYDVSKIDKPEAIAGIVHFGMG